MSSILKSLQFWLKFAVKTRMEKKKKKKKLPILSQSNSFWKFIRVIPILKKTSYKENKGPLGKVKMQKCNNLGYEVAWFIFTETLPSCKINVFVVSLFWCFGFVFFI